MAKPSSLSCSVWVYLIIGLLSGTHGQQKDGEFKHELPDDVELVDPKSLGLTDADLTKFLGNVKVLGGGQIGDTKTQILSVGFDGDENINFNDFVIPGLTDGKNTSLPEKDKEIADMAFKRFKEFFEDPKKAKHFDDGKNQNAPFHPQNKAPERPKQNNIPVPPQTPNQFHIPMIQKPYTTPRVPLTLPVTTHHPPRKFNQPPPHPTQQHNIPHPPRPTQIRFPSPRGQQHTAANAQQAFNSQIKSPPQHLEFGARIPASPNPQLRPQQPPPVVQHQQQNQGQFQNQNHRIIIQHPNHQQTNIPNPNHQHVSIQHPNHQQIKVPHPNQQVNIQHPNHQPNNIQPTTFQQQQPPQTPHLYVQPPVVQQEQPKVPQPFVNHQQPRPPPLQNIIIQHPIPIPQSQNIQQQNPIQTRPPVQTSQEQGRVVRNQLLQLDGSSSNNKNFQQHNYLNYHTPPQLRPPPPPPPAQTPPFPSATNQVPVHSHVNQHQPPAAAATATSHVYIQRGPKTTTNSIQHTPFHPQFQAPTRFAKDFTPLPIQITTSRPIKYDVTPSMKLIPLSTNENAITDPTRMLQLRLYQQQKAQASSNHQVQTALPQSVTSTPPPKTTPIISITTSYPETNQFSSSDYQSGSHSAQQYDPRLNNHLEGGNNNVHQHDIYNGKHIFPLQSQQLQSNSIPQLQQNRHPGLDAQFLPQTQPPSVFFSEEHRRPPREGPSIHSGPPPRFQFHMSHELGQPPRFHMYPDPKNMLNSIRRKRGYRRLSDLFNRMFRWERH